MHLQDLTGVSFIPQEKFKSPKRLQCTVTQRYNNIDVGSLARPGHVKMFLMPYANNTGADQPAHARSLFSTFVVRCLDSMICILPISKVLFGQYDMYTSYTQSLRIQASFCS